MRILQFTDIHIAAEGVKTFDVDVRANLDKLLKRINEINPDHVVLSGDLCFREPKVEVYEWLRKTFDEANVNPIVIPGNHDDQGMLRQVFEMPETLGGLFFNKNIAGVDCIFLDTASGILCDTQLGWLSSQLKYGSRALIFMHHPPFACGVPYMDKNHALKSQDEFLNAVKHYTDPLNIFCGHYHVDRVVQKGNISVAITPSTFFQIRSDIEEFGIDNYRPGYRMIDIVHGGIRHWVEYLD